MTIVTDPVVEAPDWLSAEMPPGYRTRLQEIERLSADLRAMEAIGRVLWATGAPLRDAVASVFAELKFELEPATSAAGAMAVKLGNSRRLLVVVADAPGPVDKTHEDITRAFQTVQFAEAGDRVVFVVYNDASKPPAARVDPVLPDALGLLERMGVAVVTTVTLFRLWRLSLEDQQKTRKALERLESHEGGLFDLWAH